MSDSKSSAYKNVVKGRLVLKGHGAVKAPTARPAGTSSTTSLKTTSDEASLGTKRKEPLKRNSVEASDRTSPTGTASDNQRTKIQETKEQSATEKKTTQAPAPEPKRVKTKAEEELERIQQMKLEKLAKERAAKTHRELVEEYNAAIAALSEHHDIPKVGPG